MSILSVSQLSKNYGPVRALREVSFEVPAGQVFGLLGPNGSGKTSLLGIVLGILQATGGSFRWQSGIRKGCLLETCNFYPYLTGAENLFITAQLRGVKNPDVHSILEEVGLASQPKLTFSQYSLGMKQRLAIGAAMLGDPQVVVLDEPTNGLDPAGIADVRALIQKIAQQGRSVVMASHLLDEVEKVCTHVAILKKGQMLACGSLAEVLRDQDTLEVGCSQPERLEELVRQHPACPELQRQGELFLLKVESGQLNPADFNRHCAEHQLFLNHLILRKKTLESKFLELTDRASS